MAAQAFLEKLKQGLEAGDWKAAKSLCETLSTRLRHSCCEFEIEHAREILSLLRRARRFPEFLAMAEALLRWFGDDPHLKRQYGQALIENRQLLAAIQWLSQCEEDLRGRDEIERKEVVGLLGRAHKQLFSERKDGKDLQKAIDWYHLLYKNDRTCLWHGINVVCLASIADRDGYTLTDEIDYRAMAKEILFAIKNKPVSERSCWDEATIAEALVALGRPGDAITFIERFAAHKGVGAFAMASTLRQFDDVWELDEMEGDYLALIDILRSKLMLMEGGEIVTEFENLAKISLKYEKRFTSAAPLPRTWFLQLVDCSRFVGRVWHKSLFGFGTGFLIDDGGQLNEIWNGHQIFVTCNHLISEEHNSQGALFPNEVTVTFDSLEKPGCIKPKRYRIQQILWESPHNELDITISQLTEYEDRIHSPGLGEPRLDIMTDHEQLPDSKDERVYIVGHPQGGEMSFSFQDNQFIAKNRRRIQYITPTNPGSSGSPVFDQHLNLIAMHHAGGEFMESLTETGATQKANQGIPMPAIIEALKAEG